MTIFPCSRQVNIEHDIPKPEKKKSKKKKNTEEKEIIKNELFFFAIVKNVHLKCSNCFLIDSDNRISKAEDLPNDSTGWKKITTKSLLIGTELLIIKNIRDGNHLIQLLTEANCFCYIKYHDQKEQLNYQSTNIWSIPVNKGIVFLFIYIFNFIRWWSNGNWKTSFKSCY